MAKKIQILDCTLRDGGYINNWQFNKDDVKNIIELLQKANIDYIEAGFLTSKKQKTFSTLFNSFDDVEKILPKNPKNIFLMLNYGDFEIDNIPLKKNTNIEGIRLIFKKDKLRKSLDLAKKIIDKGYKLFINPTYINTYDTTALYELIQKTNEINPFGFSLVDTLGILNKENISEILKILKNLNQNISLCFHSHDNTQLAFLNAIDLINQTDERNIIIDTTLYAMGRGAGNIQSELFAKYLNDNYSSNYDMDCILKIIDNYIIKIFDKYPWGYCKIYEICAINQCHINYAKYLIEKNINDIKKTDEILKQIPNHKKLEFDKKIIDYLLKN